ncbi:hypothetical protein CYPRO_3119 [Cyclonatronum proteinivorum]|uniref:Uncharacterized protein n=1 Tax=Cyclonatronum proteinivorum TaxID=1457365 RepID=A0A345UPF2_9BACT|nr:hypothetical protein CYPRO_3119 [Cyclonatronum proteinivorum]
MTVRSCVSGTDVRQAESDRVAFRLCSFFLFRIHQKSKGLSFGLGCRNLPPKLLMFTGFSPKKTQAVFGQTSGFRLTLPYIRKPPRTMWCAEAFERKYGGGLFFDEDFLPVSVLICGVAEPVLELCAAALRPVDKAGIGVNNICLLNGVIEAVNEVDGPG